jgi:protein CpxP
MKNVFILATLFVSSIASLSTIAWADDGHGHKSNKGGDKMNSSMMGQEQMIAMQEHMQTMNNIMTKIKGTNDSKQRNQLMQQHMDEMQKGMQTMMHGDGNNKVNSSQMEMRLDMMQNQMGMMQQLMEQMMQHQSQERMPHAK